MSNLTPHLFVEDMTGSLAFYRDVMHFELKRAEPDNNPTFASLQRGDSGLMLSSFGESFEGWSMVPEAEKRRGTGGPVSFYIEAIDSLEDEYARAQVLGATIVDPLQTRPWGQTEFTMADPDGFWWAVWTA
ncbi:MAG: VOC family protein [Anaerolineaceae bacterium]